MDTSSSVRVWLYLVTLFNDKTCNHDTCVPLLLQWKIPYATQTTPDLRIVWDDTLNILEISTVSRGNTITASTVYFPSQRGSKILKSDMITKLNVLLPVTLQDQIQDLVSICHRPVNVLVKYVPHFINKNCKIESIKHFIYPF